MFAEGDARLNKTTEEQVKAKHSGLKSPQRGSSEKHCTVIVVHDCPPPLPRGDPRALLQRKVHFRAFGSSTS